MQPFVQHHVLYCGTVVFPQEPPRAVPLPTMENLISRFPSFRKTTHLINHTARHLLLIHASFQILIPHVRIANGDTARLLPAPLPTYRHASDSLASAGLSFVNVRVPHPFLPRPVPTTHAWPAPAAHDTRASGCSFLPPAHPYRHKSDSLA